MHIPKGKPVHEHLKTSYVNTAALLADLQVSGFTGYLQIIFPYGRGYIFFKAGKILNAIDEDADRARRGEEAIDAILLRASAPDGGISIYTHAVAFVDAIAGRIDGEVVYQRLETEFTDLKKLIAKLQQQSEARFYIEVEISGQGDGVIYIIDGCVDAVLSLVCGDILEGDGGYQRILSMVEADNALLHVYRWTMPAPAAANVIALADFTASAAASKMAAPVEEEFDDEIVEEELDEPTDEVNNQTIAATHQDEVEEPAAKSESPVAVYGQQYEDLISLMGEVVQVVERAAVLVAKEANFAVALRAGLLDVTEQYPFFDPFAAEFKYQDGKISIATAAPPADLVIGLTQALKRALREMARMVPAGQLRQVVADALSRLQQLRQSEYEHFGLSPAIAEIVALD